jgi:hypothetical protein
MIKEEPETKIALASKVAKSTDAHETKNYIFINTYSYKS